MIIKSVLECENVSCDSVEQVAVKQGISLGGSPQIKTPASWVHVRVEEGRVDGAGGMVSLVPRYFCSWGCLGDWAKDGGSDHIVDGSTSRS